MPLWLAGRAVQTGATLAVVDKHTGREFARVARADAGVADAAIAAAARAAPALRELAGFRRREILEHVGRRVHDRAEEFARALVAESGKLIGEARGEVARALDTFRLAAEESTRITGEWLPLDISARAAGLQAIVRRFPLGPAALITPFNFPLNLAAHKIGPAIAAGCPFVLKPAPATPVCALLLGEILAEAGLPEGAFSVLPCENDVAEQIATDPRVRVLSFTGSTAVGWRLRSLAGTKRVTLELGGNAACIVERDADVKHAAERITFGAFYQAGQSCISVQRVYAQRGVYAALREELARRAAALRAGDPLDERTTLGPLISEREAQRVEEWVRLAVAAGAQVVCGGARRGAFHEATWLEKVSPDQKVSCEEVFGPVATLAPFDEFDEAIAAANAGRFGLQAGVFTGDLGRALRAFEALDVGGVILNDVPSLRVDNMPYGGAKDSGLGREGVRYAIEEFTERRVLVMRGGG